MKINFRALPILAAPFLVALSSIIGFPPALRADRTLTRLSSPAVTGNNVAIEWKSTGGLCDGNNIAACGVTVIDTMVVRGGSIHSMEEFLIVDSLAERAALSALTILRLADGA